MATNLITDLKKSADEAQRTDTVEEFVHKALQRIQAARDSLPEINQRQSHVVMFFKNVSKALEQFKKWLNVINFHADLDRAGKQLDSRETFKQMKAARTTAADESSKISEDHFNQSKKS